jgi:iron transport multicopper oxidase
MRSAVLAIFAAAALPAFAAVREVWYDITYVEDTNPDGLGGRTAVGINGTWPYVLALF